MITTQTTKSQPPEPLRLCSEGFTLYLTPRYKSDNSIWFAQLKESTIPLCSKVSFSILEPITADKNCETYDYDSNTDIYKIYQPYNGPSVRK